MENKVTIFENEEFGKIRTVVINNEPWFVGKDVCNVFGDKNHVRSIGRINNEDKSVVPIVDSMGRTQNVTVLNESGLYSLLFTMQPQKAHKTGVSDEYPIEQERRMRLLHDFKHWVTSEVLPTIRKTGGYVSNIDLMIETYFSDVSGEQKFLIKGLLSNIEEQQKRNVALSNENRILVKENLEWGDRQLINALVRTLAANRLHGDFVYAWNWYKKELLYKHGINLNARITNYLESTGNKKKPKTLDMLEDVELPNALSTIVSMCKECEVDIDDLLRRKAS